MAKRINYKKGDLVGNCTFLENVENISYTLHNGRIISMRRGKFKCYCEKEFISNITFVKCKKTQSCGCKGLKWKEGRKQHIKHGHSIYNNKSEEYGIWTDMKRRCSEENIMTKKNYFDKGIIVCDRWKNSFINFLEDMGKRPSSKHSLDRIDGNNGYSPENCRWATIHEQSGNKSSNIMISFNGETKCLSHWAKEHNLRSETLEYRYKMGWGMEKALNTVPRQYNYSKR